MSNLPRQVVDITGQRFGRLVVKEFIGTKRRNALWSCICDCGGSTEAIGYALRSGIKRSCGCWMQEAQAKFSAMVKTDIPTNPRKKKLLDVFYSMQRRCYDSKHKAYRRYGGRGIYVCEEWRDNFPAFYYWALENGYKEGLTLDRENNDGPYAASNCRWTTRQVQAQNRGVNIFITAFEETKVLAEWTRDPRCAGLKGDTIKKRIADGWKSEDAISKPTKYGPKKKRKAS